jgi:hypothetical protein
MSARQPLDLDAPLTDAEVRELHQHLPDFVRVGDEARNLPSPTSVPFVGPPERCT